MNTPVSTVLRSFCIFLAFAHGVQLPAQDDSPTADDVAAEAADVQKQAPEIDVAEKVEVNPTNSDGEIEVRLREIFEATGWFESAEVRVDGGVAFLSGTADSVKHQQWAEATAMKTADVVAVVNRIKVSERSIWDFTPALQSMKQLGREATQLLPLLLVAVLVTFLSYYVAWLAGIFASRLSSKRLDSKLLEQVVSNVIAVLVFIIGFYIALRVSGLTRLAVTLLGGTGLIGLALGFAFRDIAENYLASILISLNQPFRVGDLIEIEGAKGHVRAVTTRGTVLNTLEGNQIQIPNSTVYKSRILNYTATPLLRIDFTVGIGFDDVVSEAQQVIMNVLQTHNAIVSDPAPMVLVEALGAATVNLRCYYWMDQQAHSSLKVGSNVIRLVKDALMKSGISMPDEARELVFPHGVPVKMLEADASVAAPRLPATTNGQKPSGQDTRGARGESAESHGEGDLSNEQDEVLRATQGNEVASGENLID